MTQQKLLKPANINILPPRPGVYSFLDKTNKIIYVGKALNLKNRISSYFLKGVITPKTKTMVSKIDRISYIEVPSELEALLLEAYLIRAQQPFFNTRARDDKHPLYVKITVPDEFPRVFVVRREDKLDSFYFGPFPSTQTLRQVLRFLRAIFPFDTQKTIGERPCFWSHLGLCSPCPSEILKLGGVEKRKAKAKYRKNITNLINVLSRKTDKVKVDLTREMKNLSKAERFEDAAFVRDQITRLDYITREYKSISSFLENPNLVSDIRQQELDVLTQLLTSHFPHLTSISRIECYDASHTAMVNPTVGMVTFINGEPDKNFYRKFRIKRVGSTDDLAFLEEALRRRFAHEEWDKPDLVVIDGGKTQVGRAREVLKKLKLRIPVIGLVKPFDDVVFPHQDGFQIVRLRSGPALRLLQRLRDEAHRFARSYHIKLRSRSVLN